MRTISIETRQIKKKKHKENMERIDIKTSKEVQAK